MNRIILVFVATALWFSSYTCVPILTVFAHQLGASYQMVGLIVGIYGFTQFALRIPVGILSEAWGSRKIFILAGIAASALSGLSIWLFPVVGMLLFSRALAGVASASWVDFTVLYASYFPKEDAPKAVGYINSVLFLGSVLGMLAGGYAAQLYGYVFPFVMSVIVGGVGLVLAFFLRERRLPPQKAGVQLMRECLRDKNLLRLSWLGIVVQGISYVTTLGFVPVVAADLGAGNLELGLLTAVATVPTIFGSALSGTFFRRHAGERGTLVIGFVALGLSSFVIPFIPSLSFLYLSQALGGFGLALTFSPLMGLSIKNFTDEKRSTAMGIYQSMYGLGMFGGPVLTGFLGSNFGLDWAFWFAGLIGWAGALLALWRRYLPL